MHDTHALQQQLIALQRSHRRMKLAFGALAATKDALEPIKVEPCWFEPAAPHQTPRYDRDRLPGGLEVKGPAIVEDAWSTIVVPPGYGFHADTMGHLWIRQDAP